MHVQESAAYFEADSEQHVMVSFLDNPELPVLRLETGLAGSLAAEACPCGSQSPRLVNLKRRPVKRKPPMSMTAAAASAVG